MGTNTKNASVRKFINQNTLTVTGVIIVYAVLGIMLYGGATSRQLASMLVPVSCYIVLAVSLNLVVGLLGELSLGHAGFMAVGLFSGCLFSIATVSLPAFVRLPLAMIIGGLAAAASQGRLSCHSDACLR